MLPEGWIALGCGDFDLDESTKFSAVPLTPKTIFKSEDDYVGMDIGEEYNSRAATPYRVHGRGC